MPTAEKLASSRSDVADRLQKKGIVATVQRIEIGHSILTRRRHLSADHILAEVNGDNKTIVSKATVYNTLNLFTAKGLVREIFADPVRVYYEPVTSEHYHFYDSSSSTLHDIDPKEVTISKLPIPPAGMTITGIDVVIRIDQDQTFEPNA